jgi:hypothetical protein
MCAGKREKPSTQVAPDTSPMIETTWEESAWLWIRKHTVFRNRVFYGLRSRGWGQDGNAVDLSTFELLPPPGAPFVGRSFGDSGL